MILVCYWKLKSELAPIWLTIVKVIDLAFFETGPLHKFTLEFQKYHKADRDTILRSESASTDSC